MDENAESRESREPRGDDHRPTTQQRPSVIARILLEHFQEVVKVLTRRTAAAHLMTRRIENSIPMNHDLNARQLDFPGAPYARCFRRSFRSISSADSDAEHPEL